MKTKLCAMVEHQFCLCVSDKLGKRETIISMVPIIESRTRSGFSKEGIIFPGTKR